jgi:Flp pilus assembly protein TadD
LARMRLASAYIGMGDYDKGMAELLEARQLQPGNPELVAMAGRTALRQRDFLQAVQLLEQAVELDTLDLVYRNDLATALMLAGEKDEAVSQWRWILARSPDPGLEQVVRQNLDRAQAQE